MKTEKINGILNMKTLLKITFVLCLAAPAFGQFVDTLPPLKDGKAPQTFAELWDGYDPREEPLDVEILKEWEEDGVVMKVLRYRVGVFNGKKAMMAAVYGYPKGATNVPGLVQMHGGGQSASYKAVLTNAKRGYATLSIAWAGRLHAPDYHVQGDIVKLFWEGKTDDPHYRLTTDWGGVDAYHAPCRYEGSDYIRNSPSKSEYTADPVESPRNSGWFLCTIGSRRALTFLEQQPEVDAERLGAYGHSMGGKLTVMLAGSDSRLKAAAPSCGGISDLDVNKTPRLILDDASLENISCPIFFLSPANDFHGHIEHLQVALDQIKSKDWRITCAPHHQHQDTKDYEVAAQIWFDQTLKHNFETPETPRTKLKLHTRSGVPEISILPDTTREILSVDVFVTREAAKKPADRFWHHIPAKKGNGKWTASLELYGVDQPLWVYANVRYKLDKEITGAGYYYGVYTTDSFVLSSRMHMITPQELATNRVRSVLQAEGQIEDFSQEWKKEWYNYSNDPENWRMTTRKLGDDLYRAPDFAKLAFSVRAQSANQLLLKIDDLSAVVEVEGGNAWQHIVLHSMDFKGAEGKTRLDWKGIKSLMLGDVGGKWQGTAPELRDMRWIAGTRAERDARRTVKLLDVKPVDGKTYLDIDHAEPFIHGYQATMNTWLDGKSPLINQGKTFPHGLTTHAYSEAVYFLGGKYKTFRSLAQAGPSATVVFQVFVDDEKVFDSGLMTRNQWKQIDLPVANAMELKLVVTDGGNGIGSDHASWIDAHLQN
jgi:hypothetical protein